MAISMVISMIAILLTSAPATTCLEKRAKGHYDFNMCITEAKKGNSASQFLIGMMYFGGVSVEQDTSNAIIWLERAGENGHPRAQTMLGTIFAGGQGVSVEIQKAKSFFEMAASRGDPDACFHLGTLYANGLGVKPNRTISYMYFTLSEKFVEFGVMPILDKGMISEYRQIVGQNLLPGQKLKAQTDAETRANKLTCLKQKEPIFEFDVIECKEK